MTHLKTLFAVMAVLVCVLVLTSRGMSQSQTSATVAAVAVTTPPVISVKPLPAVDAEFTSQVERLVRNAKLDEPTTAGENSDREDEWSSVCVIDMTAPAAPRLAGWKMDNLLYPASTYKMYVLGEAVRQVCAGERSLDDPTTVVKHNSRDPELPAEKVVPLAEILRLMCMYSNNTAANVAIDVVDRKRATALLHALGCYGSEVTRKFLPRTAEDAEFTSAPSTVSCALHFAKFLWAVENGAIGGGRGRGLIKGYLATNVQNYDRFRKGLPASATICSKTGEWSNFTAEAAIVEDGPLHYIVCMMTAKPRKVAAPRMAEFVKSLHELIAAHAAAR